MAGKLAKILVIDDEFEVRKMLRKMLEKAGYEVTEARNGAVGINEYRKDPADVVITDIIMPDKEGMETIRELKKEFPDVKIIAMTGGNEMYLSTAKKFGVRGAFMKPLNQSKLLGAVKELLT